MIELDANFLVAALRSEERATRMTQRAIARNDEIAMSPIAWSEFLCGPLIAGEHEQARLIVTHILPFTIEDGELAAHLFNASGRRSRSHADCMIAAHAIRRGAELATLNAVDFRRFEKFKLRLVAP
ncbi:MAG: type II toxin-antitoxin system VapC family toxin [Verrucomicrobiota bacterium]|nr:type II toxin-antitoxin system VapC family toxin [Verrucomicrobiota bacterium]MDQ6939937.1 type II toxin-antitoxin system VapC family toxin [Verrucomicrobiota bacterium]